MQDFEKLGAFYLGREYDLGERRAREALVLYDSRDLVTHAVCVGMTGSGKTGLCLGVLEEAAIDGIPAIVIDPKGDLANLLLTFPDLSPADFLPWVNEDDARRKNLTPAEYAAQQATLWREGLAKWGQDGARIRRLRDAAEFAIYTPGSTAGIPVSIVKSFAAPDPASLDDAEQLRERVATSATSLLGLLGVDADPVQSREHILLSTILANHWKQGRDLDLPSLIQQIQSPPVQRVGVIDLESFFPSKERFALAMRLNNLLAAPGFESWLEGEALDVGRFLYTAQGKPRVAIFSIAHLGDAERMFFVSLLLNGVVGWMRQQPGTTSLRALVYMDEIFGYFPPVANPPSKAPLLTLLKQARAYGVGVMLATQNPVDLDYKGLGNCGTWFIGRLQTERDKARVLDGLEGASGQAGAGFDRGEMERLLGALGNRVFLMNNVHDDAPVVFETRWAMSYLRGPLTRQQIRQLTAGSREAQAPPTAVPHASAAAAHAVGGSVTPPPLPSDTDPAAGVTVRQVMPPQVSQVFLPVRGVGSAGAALVYRPMLIGVAEVYFDDAKLAGAAHRQEVTRLLPLPDSAADVRWETADAPTGLAQSDLEPEPRAGAGFETLPPSASQPKNYDAWKRALADALFRTERLDLFKSPAVGETSRPGESERDFRIRLQQAAREQRDAKVEQLRRKHDPKFAALRERHRRAQQAVDREAEQARHSKVQTAISVGSTVLGALFGRKTVSAGNVGRAATAARGVGRSMKESQDVARAGETAAAVRQQIDDLEAQFQSDTQALEARFDPAAEVFETIGVRPKKSSVTVRLVALAWAPHWQTPGGGASPAWA